MKWKKQSGLEIETNDEPATIAHCESIGWKRVTKKAPAKKSVKKVVKKKAK